MTSKLLITFAIFGAWASESATAESPARFRDSTTTSGITFIHASPFTEERHTHLTFGSGIGWVDFDRDGWPDLYAAQGAPFSKAERQQFADQGESSDRLYRNLGRGQFEDVSEICGLNDNDYSMGVSVGDFNNDGFSDIYITNFGRNRLLNNNGDGTFTEVAAELEVDDPSFGSSATWADLDSDGNLDLFVCNYLQFDINHYQLCTAKHNGQSYGITCHPRSVPAERDVLFRNQGDGRFSHWPEQTGLAQSPARPGLGIVAADLDADGDVDLYIANDSVANDLWINQGDGRLTNQGMLSGTAFNRNGQREAGMGAVAGDVDGDGRPDLFVTNYYGETNTLYRNESDGLFLDVTDEFGLGGPSRTRLAFGTNLFDYDNDGWQDVFVANGHVHDRLELLGRDEPFAQPAQLYHNQSGRRFADVSGQAGPYFQRSVVGRSSAVADYDRDGWLDLAVGHLNGKLVLLHNEPGDSRAKSLQIELVGVRSNRDAIGAVIEIPAGERRLTRFRAGSSGYLSTDEGTLTIGIGERDALVNVTVKWPSGNVETFPSLETASRQLLVEGQAKSR